MLGFLDGSRDSAVDAWSVVRRVVLVPFQIAIWRFYGHMMYWSVFEDKGYLMSLWMIRSSWPKGSSIHLVT